MRQSGTKRSSDAAAGPSTKHGKWLHDGQECSLHEHENPSNSRGKKLCDGVYSLYEPKGQPEVEMVFIHGFQRDCKDAYWTTWLARDGSEDNCWPQTWLAAEFPKARIFSISYETSRAFESGKMDLYPFGETLVQEMVFPGIDIGQHGCPLVFVCHCVGGLVAKQIIVLAHDRFRQDKRIEKLLCNTKAFVFYATPHGRCELISMDSETEVGRLNSAFEAIQRVEFKNKWRVRVIAETHATSKNLFYSSMIVKEPSARHVGYTVMHVAADHFDICKPKSKTDTSFLYLIGCAEDVVAEYRSMQGKMLVLPSCVVGVDEKVSELCEKLKDNPIVGLVGMGGVGKTTLSKVMYNRKRQHYDRWSYLEDVKSSGDIVRFQKQLLRDLCDEKWDKNEDPEVYLRMIKQCIETKKVLVVIDDVGSEANLEALHVLAFAESGSRLVITCRDRAILLDYISEGEMVEVVPLANEAAMELFTFYAFHNFNGFHEIGNEDRAEFGEEAVNIVNACGGLPLSIEVIGQYLRKQNRFPRDKRMDMWLGALRRLREAEAIDGRSHDEKLWRKLKVSYDDLGNPEKRLFLDFACILCDRQDLHKDTIARIWDDHAGVQTLIDSSLIKVGNEHLTQGRRIIHFEDVVPRSSIETLVIHNQLRDMGRWIVRDLAKKYSEGHLIHIWKEDDVQQFLEDNEGSKTLEGLSIAYENMKLRPGESRSSQAFVNKILGIQHSHRYPNLRLLDLLHGDMVVVEHIFQFYLVNPKCLTWLCLNDTKILKSHLEIFHAKFKSLRVLHMRDCWEVVELPSSIGELRSIKELDLGVCEKLRTLPTAIGKLGNLQVLILEKCNELEELPESIGNLVELLELDLSNCISLKSLPCTLGNLKRLKLLNLRGCVKVEVIPSGAGQLMKLESLALYDCRSLRTMCEFEKEMYHLHTLDLGHCVSLESFKSLGNLHRLRTLNLKWCGRLCIPNLAECVGQLLELQFLNLEGCDSMAKEVAEVVGNGHLFPVHLVALCLSAFPETALPLCPQLKFLQLINRSIFCGEEKELPKAFSESLDNLAQLQVLRLRGLKFVPKSVELEILHVSDSSYKRLPEHVGDLLSLRELSLSGCGELVELPLSLGSLSQLRSLDLIWCEKLEHLPDSLGRLTQLRELKLDYCVELERLPESLGALIQLRELHLCSCEKLERLPDSLGGLTQLQDLNLRWCMELERLPDSLGALTQLKQLDLSSCEKLERLPDSLGRLTRLQQLNLSSCKELDCLPESLGKLTQLKQLDLSSCQKLEHLPDSLGGLTQLELLNLSSCEKLECLPESLGGLTQLESLELGFCSKLERLPDSLGRVTRLSFLDLSDCIKLEGKEEVQSALQERGCTVYT